MSFLENNYGPYFNKLSAWSKAHGASTLRAGPKTFASLTTGKIVGASNPWSKRVVPLLSMSNGCFLGVSCKKTIRM